MATITTNFGTNTALTVTNLHSLPDGDFWQSAAIDNGTIFAMWMEVFVTILTTTTAAADGLGTISLYLAGSTDGAVDFAGGATGTEGLYNDLANLDSRHLRFIESASCDASETTARTYKYHFVVRDGIPEDFALVLKNDCGATLGATTNAVEYRLNKYNST